MRVLHHVDGLSGSPFKVMGTLQFSSPIEDEPLMIAWSMTQYGEPPEYERSKLLARFRGRSRSRRSAPQSPGTRVGAQRGGQPEPSAGVRAVMSTATRSPSLAPERGDGCPSGQLIGPQVTGDWSRMRMQPPAFSLLGPGSHRGAICSTSSGLTNGLWRAGAPSCGPGSADDETGRYQPPSGTTARRASTPIPETRSRRDWARALMRAMSRHVLNCIAARRELFMFFAVLGLRPPFRWMAANTSNLRTIGRI